MPGNVIQINDVIRYYVGDSKMEELIKWLNTNGKQMLDAGSKYTK